MAVGLPDSSVDRIFDFIDDIWDGMAILVLALVEMLWDLFVAVVIDITPALGFALILSFWLYMFHIKYIADSR